jgi:ADP-ribosyl-[dinitrogen reductase] hydrolase
MSATDRAPAILLGLACGDALGRPVEFRSAAQINQEFGQLYEMIGNGTHNQPPGTITDDTELALRIASSLVERGEFDGADVAERFVEWYRSGPFDIGMMTADALRRIGNGTSWDEAGKAVWEDRPEGQNAGNGSVMRCAPYSIAFAEDPDRLISVSKASSRITHADPCCTYGCAVLNLTLAGLLHNQDEPLAKALDRVRPEAPEELVEALEPVAERESIDTLQNSGYVIHSLQTALHDAFAADNVEEAIVTAVNRGNDTDTIGAIAGAVAGARFGAGSLPERWLETIDEREELIALALELHEISRL